MNKKKIAKPRRRGKSAPKKLGSADLNALHSDVHAINVYANGAVHEIVEVLANLAREDERLALHSLAKLAGSLHAMRCASARACTEINRYDVGGAS